MTRTKSNTLVSITTTHALLSQIMRQKSATVSSLGPKWSIDTHIDIEIELANACRIGSFIGKPTKLQQRLCYLQNDTMSDLQNQLLKYLKWMLCLLLVELGSF